MPNNPTPAAESTGVAINVKSLKPKLTKKQQLDKKNRELEKDDYIQDVVGRENPEYVNKVASIIDPTPAMDVNNIVEKLVREGKVNPTDVAGLVANIIPGNKQAKVFMKVAGKAGDVAGYNNGGKVMGYENGGEVEKKKQKFISALAEYNAAKKYKETNRVDYELKYADEGLEKLKKEADAAKTEYENELKASKQPQKEPFSASGAQIENKTAKSVKEEKNTFNKAFRKDSQESKPVEKKTTGTFAGTRRTKPENLPMKETQLAQDVTDDKLRGGGDSSLRQDAVVKGTTTPANKGTNTSGAGKSNADGIYKAVGMGRDVLSGLSNYIIPYKQTKMGLDFLAKAGSRPIDEVDPGFQESVDRANANAKFGLSPEEQAYINQQNLGLMNSEKAAARNYSGGSASNAFNMERSAIGNYFTRGLEAQIQNRNLQQNKQRYADSMNIAKANKMRELYDDRLNAWNQNQMAGSQLVGSGLNNIIGAKMYGDELRYMRENQNLQNNWLNNLNF